MTAKADKRPGPTPEQKRATDPDKSAWVSASAGSGKTFVLARRVLRLLRRGVDPGRILCLTFTRAAAAEMTNRVFGELGKWAVMGDDQLAAELRALEDNTPSQTDLDAARRLFATALETPGGLKVQTIHAFAERVLHRFPFEANIPAHFDVLDDAQAADLRARAIHRTLHEAAGDRVLGAALDTLAAQASETRFADLIGAVVSSRSKFRDWIRRAGDLEDALAELAKVLGADAALTDSGSLMEQICHSPHLPEAGWPGAIEALSAGTKTDNDQAGRFRRALALAGDARTELYLSIFRTGSGTMRKSIATKTLANARPDLAAALEDEKQRLEALLETINAQNCFCASAALFRLADRTLQHYEGGKLSRGLLDYDDLIARTLTLLTREGAAEWVLYKLDGGIDHILIDEAQDTSADQWQIIARLAEEGLSGEGVREMARTVFAVGDEKQSIYSFQGADPARFDEMRRYFARRVEAAEQGWDNPQLNLSFRSGPAVLDAVDRVFAGGPARQGLGPGDAVVRHTPHRNDAAGFVELWPVDVRDDAPDPDPWDAPVDRTDPASPRSKLAEKIAQAIAHWLNSKTPLESSGKPIRPGDILVLVRRRNDFVDSLVGRLRDLGVPVAGADRLVLQEHIAVMDLLVAADVALLPDDDLALATLLKSPLIGISEEDLMDLAATRKGPLYAALAARAGEPVFAAAQAFVASLRRMADFDTPFAFFSSILGPMKGRRRLLARLGPEAADAIDEFLQLALGYEETAAPSLQGFVHQVRGQQAEVKRNLDQARGQVRIMTVHGAKGLEAPIVFLPDTCDMPDARHDGPLFALDAEEGGDAPPLAWAPGRKETQPGAVADARQREQAARQAEYYRLLYVAMTRACDRLYVCGAPARGTPAETCWYEIIRQALAPVLRELTDDDGTVIAHRYEAGTPAQVAEETAEEQEKNVKLPAWTQENAPAPPPAPVRLVPSRIELEEAAGPVETSTAGADAARRRGTLIHALLERLHPLNAAARPLSARRVLAALAPEAGKDETDALIAEALPLFDHPDLAALFAPGSRAEVSIGGAIGAHKETGLPVVVSGQIDRLAVTDREVLIADYKTNRIVPETPETVPTAYVAQLAAYRRAANRLFPGKPVRAVIVWTAAPALMEIPPLLLDKAESRMLAGDNTGT